MDAREVETKIRQLPEDLRREVLNYVEFLLQKYKNKKARVGGFQFDWEGGLAGIKEKFTSVDLQHKALDWR